MKNYDRGLENAALGLRPLSAFSSRRSQFVTKRADPKSVNDMFIFCLAVNWLTSGLVYATFAFELAYVSSTNHS